MIWYTFSRYQNNNVLKNYCQFNSVFVLWIQPSHKNWIGMTNLITFSEIKIHMPDSKVDQKW